MNGGSRTNFALPPFLTYCSRISLDSDGPTVLSFSEYIHNVGILDLLPSSPTVQIKVSGEHTPPPFFAPRPPAKFMTPTPPSGFRLTAAGGANPPADCPTSNILDL